MKLKIFIIALSLAFVSTNALTQVLPTAVESKPLVMLE